MDALSDKTQQELKAGFATLSAPSPLGNYHQLEDDLMDGEAHYHRYYEEDYLDSLDWFESWQLQELLTPLDSEPSIWV